MDPQLVVALDTDIETARHLVLSASNVLWFKVGYRLFLRHGQEIIPFLQANDKRIFLDLKFHDIPNTMVNAAREVVSLGVDMFNVHVSAGSEALTRVMEMVELARREGKDVLCIGVTRLTSQEASLDDVVDMARLAKECGLDGVVCSVYEVEAIKAVCGRDFLCVCPGIRPGGNSKDDQRRVASPMDARERGADFIVMGRPILEMSEADLQRLPGILFQG